MAVCASYKIPHSQFLEWDQGDRDKAIWWHIREAEKCPGCGTRHEDWEHDHNAFIGDVIRCRGCEVRQRTEASIRDDDGRGLHVVLKRRSSPQSSA